MDNQIIIPEGWTYFAHRTNTERWTVDPFNLDVIKTDRLMSVVTESDVHYEYQSYGSTRSRGYSTGSGTPFEIRCLIAGGSYVRSPDNPLSEIMLKEFYYDRRNFGGAQGQRHHSIPKDEELVVIGHGQYDEVFNRESNIIWVIPKRFLELYKRDLGKNKNRMIPLTPPEIENGKTR